MDAVDILLRLLTDDLSLPAATQVELIVHENKLNWRQRNPTVADQVRSLRGAFIHDGPFQGQLVSLDHLRKNLRLIVTRTRYSDVVSVTSRLFDPSGDLIGHLAIMNLHPEGLRDLDSLAQAIRETTGDMPGYLLTSGRYFHFYGKRILDSAEWLRFLSRFLMPCVMVSPRYIGHSLFQGFCAVRLTAALPYKPAVPSLLLVM